MNKSLEEFIKLSSIEYYKLQNDYSSLYNLLKKCRIGGYYHIGYYVGKILEKIDNWEFLDELSICAYWIGEYQESYDLCKRLIYICPENEKDRITQNKNFSAKKLGIKEIFSLEQFKKDTKEEISKLNYKKYWYQYNEEEKIQLTSEMKEIELYFKQELNLDVYPIYGTLLGMIRDNDFIGWDTDIDMAYLSKYHTNKEVLNEFNDICNFLEKKELLFYRIKTASHLHVWSPRKHLRIDLWISWIDEKGKYHLVWTIGGEMDSSVILPFKTIEFRGQKFNLINQPEHYLDEAYHNWRTPLGGTENVWKKKPFVFELEPWQGK
jgi:hypothetical protein